MRISSLVSVTASSAAVSIWLTTHSYHPAPARCPAVSTVRSINNRSRQQRFAPALDLLTRRARHPPLEPGTGAALQPVEHLPGGGEGGLLLGRSRAALGQLQPFDALRDQGPFLGGEPGRA